MIELFTIVVIGMFLIKAGAYMQKQFEIGDEIRPREKQHSNT